MRQLFWILIIIVSSSLFIIGMNIEFYTKDVVIAGVSTIVTLLFCFISGITYSIMSESYDENKELKRQKEKGIYVLKQRCPNCNFNTLYDVKKGVCKLEMLSDKNCDRCGCKLLGNNQNHSSVEEKI